MLRVQTYKILCTFQASGPKLGRLRGLTHRTVAMTFITALSGQVIHLVHVEAYVNVT